MPETNDGPDDGADGDDGSIARRSLLGTLAAAGVAGCQSFTGGSSTPTDTETPEPTPTATPHPDGTPADVPPGWPTVRDPYYGQLASTLASQGLPGGAFCYGTTEAEAMSAFSVQSSVGTAEPLSVGDDQPFSSARRVTVEESTENPWNVTLKGTVEDRAVSEGDVLLAVFHLRGPEDSESDPTAQFVAKDEANPSTNMVRGVQQAEPVGEWVRYYVPIQFDYDAEAGTWWTELFLGFGPQTVDVGGVALIDFDQNISVGNLPSGPASQPTPDDSDWEAAADERIAEHRTSELTVEVTDADGEPVEAASVDVAMQEHEFGFGAGVDGAYLLEETSRGDPYREHVSELFNVATLTNHHKWRFWEEEKHISDGVTQWLLGEGLDVRGHVCLYADVSSFSVPPDVVEAMGRTWEEGGVTEAELDPDYVREQTLSHVEDIVEYYGEDILEWEVVNELMHSPGFVQAINGVAATEDASLEDLDPVEAPILAEWFAAAREAAPEGMPLAINDFNVLAGSYEAERARYERQIQFLAESEAGLDAVGMECHFDQDETISSREIMDTLDRYAQYDVSLRVTEFDMADDAWNESDKGRFFRRFLKTVFSHPDVEEFLVWGINDANHWQGDAPFFTASWAEKPPLEEYRSLVFDEWWTETAGDTDDEGTFSTTGFHGEYQVTATVDGEELTETVTLSGGGTTVELSPDA
ncbi:endo-1,4-beta-xylanase [Halosimplex halobium]|uniref:endo-1,4-beta-xylanase n=1 Tax=Halosimplex halobium TaxID=3396618 RepID=UPI003F543BE8